MHYRIVQILKPYFGHTSHGGIEPLTPCYVVETEKFQTPELAHKEISERVEAARFYRNRAGISEPQLFSEDWFIVIQCF